MAETTTAITIVEVVEVMTEATIEAWAIEVACTTVPDPGECTKPVAWAGVTVCCTYVFYSIKVKKLAFPGRDMGGGPMRGPDPYGGGRDPYRGMNDGGYGNGYSQHSGYATPGPSSYGGPPKGNDMFSRRSPAPAMMGGGGGGAGGAGGLRGKVDMTR